MGITRNFNPYIIFVVSIVSLAGLLFGYDTAVISGAEQSVQKYLVDSLNLGSFIHGFTVSSALIGCIIGGAISGLFADLIGRKKILIVAAILFTLSAIGSAYPEAIFFTKDEPSLPLLVMFNIYRIIGGVGVGIGSAIAPVYIGEMTPRSSRGKFVALYSVAIGLGTLIVYIVNLVIASSSPESWLDDIGWRYMFASELVPALLFFIFLFFVPETPRHLVMKNNSNKAEYVLKQIFSNSKEALNTLKDIKESSIGIKRDKLFAYGKFVIFLGVAIAIFQQLLGINIIMYYAPRVFETMGAEGVASFFQTVIVGVINVVFMSLSLLFIDKSGRKPLLIWGSTICAISLLLVATLSYMDIYGLTTLIGILVFIAAFQMTWGSVTWPLVSEIFPNSIRGKAVSLATGLHWTANLTVSTTFPYLNNLMGSVSFAIYGIFSIISLFFIWKLVPEAKGQTLESLESLWNKRRVL